MIVADTSVVYALLDGSDAWHERVAAWYRSTQPRLVTTPLIVAEIDHLAGARAGSSARSAWRKDLKAGAYDVAWWTGAEEQVVDVAEQYRDLGIDLADASLVVLSHRIGSTDLATLDERHFRAVRPLSGGSGFRLLPVDG